MTRTLALAASALIGALAGLTNVGLPGVATAGTSGCNQLGGNVQSGAICRFNAADPSYTISLKFGTDYPDDQPVADYISRQRDEVVNAARVPGAKQLPYELAVNSTSYRSGTPTRTIPEYGRPWHGTASLVLTIYKDLGGEGLTKYKAFTFDYDKNRPVTFDNLFAPGINPMDSLYPAIADELGRQFAERHFKLEPSVGRDPSHYQNFAITDDTVIFFFNTKEFLPQEAGFFYAPVARTKLPPLQL